MLDSHRHPRLAVRAGCRRPRGNGPGDTLNKEIHAADNWVFAGGLFPPSSATVVRVDNGQATMTDGPFAETKEQLGGFWILQCEDLDAALSWAEKCSVACMNPSRSGRSRRSEMDLPGVYKAEDLPVPGPCDLAPSGHLCDIRLRRRQDT